MRRLALLSGQPLAAAPPARYAGHTTARDLRGGYQVVAADFNGDGKPDLVALASGMPELAWYDDPTWERHVLAGGLSRTINCVVVPVAGDSVPEIVLTSEFLSRAKDSPGASRCCSTSSLRKNGDLQK